MIKKDNKRSKLQCLLCQGMITLIKDEEDRFLIHMKTQHDAYFNLEFLRAGCRMDENEKIAVIDVMKNKSKETTCETEDIDEDIVELEETSEGVTPDKEYKMKQVQVRLPTLKLKSFETLTLSQNYLSFSQSFCQSFCSAEKSRSLLRRIPSSPQQPSSWFWQGLEVLPFFQTFFC